MITKKLKISEWFQLAGAGAAMGAGLGAIMICTQIISTPPKPISTISRAEYSAKIVSATCYSDFPTATYMTKSGALKTTGLPIELEKIVAHEIGAGRSVPVTVKEHTYAYRTLGGYGPTSTCTEVSLIAGETK